MNAVQRVTAAVDSELQAHVAPDEMVCVALSGGMDSVVLLDAVANIRRDVSAVHVHHGLSPNAGKWAAFCEALCADKQIPLSLHHVAVTADGRGIEAAARDARYAVFAALSAPWILQAHHADDAVETLLLRLNRGTGLRGLSGIPGVRTLDERHRLLRPLLALPRSVLREYSQLRELAWVEDESNDDIRLDRNYLRKQVVPIIAGRFPSWRENWLRAADHARVAQGLLEELARMDVGTRPARLSMKTLRALSSDRLRNALRYFISLHGLELPETANLADIERRIRECRSDAVLGIRIGPRALMHYRGELHCVPGHLVSEPKPFMRDVTIGESLPMPELQGTLRFVPVIGAGIAASRPAETPLPVRLVVRSRTDGEAMKLDARRPTRALKNLFQEAAVPPWDRAWLPRLAAGEALVWVPGLGIAANWQAGPDESGWLPHWEPW